MTVSRFLKKPVNWLFIMLGLMLLAMTAFVVFQPVQVVPRLAYGPEYGLTDPAGQVVDEESLSGRVILFGFGYTHDPSETLTRTLADLRAFYETVEAEGFETDVMPGLILFDAERDTPERRAAFADANGLDVNSWLLLGGDEQALKRVIGQGFGVYYEAVPLADLVADMPELAAALETDPGPDDYGYLQAERFILIDEQNIIRAEYRAPLDLNLVMRDIRLIMREKNSTGAARVVNEAAHLFLCYPQ